MFLWKNGLKKKYDQILNVSSEFLKNINIKTGKKPERNGFRVVLIHSLILTF